ncbi:MAG: 3-hydroxyisobutyrate dehydrogenase [Pseudonocardiales bacterium]|jgi:3-hydroxyisobutyrate dehydrogenase-like beta-hydroxyacid dehydrogenase|nr:3-hydroxyisobutyrate dehydrogenase [Pseudonocardiales bacterium]
MSEGRIGVIGLGKMGLPIAGHLTASGQATAGYDPSPDARAAAKAKNVDIVSDLGELVRGSACSLVVVGNDEQLLDVCLSPGGVLDSAERGHAVFICSTVSPETSIRIGERGAAVGVHVLDATLSRGEFGAIDGNLLMMAAGPEDVLQRWVETFRCFAPDIVHLGRLGAGQVGKLTNNLLVWVNLVGNYEALRLGMRFGVDQEKLRQALLLSGGDNPMMRTWRRPRPMPWAEDDMAIVMERADALRLPMPMAGLVRELVKEIKNRKREWGTDPESYENMFDFVEWLESATASATEGTIA